MFVAAFVNTDQITSEEQEMFRGLVDDVNRKTLGALLKAVKRLGTLDQSILEAVDDALERRNYLSHGFFRSHNFAILSEGRQFADSRPPAARIRAARSHGRRSRLRRGENPGVTFGVTQFFRTVKRSQRQVLAWLMWFRPWPHLSRGSFGGNQPETRLPTPGQKRVMVQ